MGGCIEKTVAFYIPHNLKIIYKIKVYRFPGLFGEYHSFYNSPVCLSKSKSKFFVKLLQPISLYS